MVRKRSDELTQGEVRAGFPGRNKGVSNRQMVTTIGRGSAPVTQHTPSCSWTQSIQTCIYYNKDNMCVYTHTHYQPQQYLGHSIQWVQSLIYILYKVTFVCCHLLIFSYSINKIQLTLFYKEKYTYNVDIMWLNHLYPNDFIKA